MNKRPKSITIISWALIIVAIVNLVSSLVQIHNPKVLELMEQNPLPVRVQYVMMFLGLAVMAVSGIAMLKGKNWGRWLFIVWSIIGATIGLATSPVKMMIIPGILVFVLVAFFLFRPVANGYFSDQELPGPEGT